MFFELGRKSICLGVLGVVKRSICTKICQVICFLKLRTNNKLIIYLINVCVFLDLIGEILMKKIILSDCFLF